MPPFRAQLPFTEVPLSIHIAGRSPALYRPEDLDRVRLETERQVRESLEGELEAQLAQVSQDWKAVQANLFQSISDRFSDALNQMRGLLPQLVVEATARVLGGFELDEKIVRRVVEDLLEEVTPGTEALEVQLCEGDLVKLESVQADLRQRFPGLSFRVNPDLKSGDCVIRTRFGVIDGRLQTKLRGLESLLG
jgi:flagellar assembly protein FliH